MLGTHTDSLVISRLQCFRIQRESRGGGAYVSDQKVVIYDPKGEPPMMAIEYAAI